MANAHRLVSLIVCDDCRREDNGKDIIIGAYTGAMITPVLPVTLPTFALRFEVVAQKQYYAQATAVMKGPRGDELIRGNGPLSVPRPQFGASLIFKVSPVVIKEAGTYTIHLGLDEEPEEVATFTVLNEPFPQWAPQPVPVS